MELGVVRWVVLRRGDGGSWLLYGMNEFGCGKIMWLHLMRALKDV